MSPVLGGMNSLNPGVHLDPLLLRLEGSPGEDVGNLYVGDRLFYLGAVKEGPDRWGSDS